MLDPTLGKRVKFLEDIVADLAHLRHLTVDTTSLWIDQQRGIGATLGAPTPTPDFDRVVTVRQSDILLGDVFDAVIDDYDASPFVASTRIWLMNLAGSTTMAPGEYNALVVRDDQSNPVTVLAGPYWMSITYPNQNNVLPDTSNWIKLISDPTSIHAYVAAIVATVAIANGAQAIVASSAPTDFASTLDLKIVDANTSITAGTVQFIGTDDDGAPLNETINIASGGTHTYTTTGSFKTVTSITVASLSGATGVDTIQVVIHAYPAGVLRTNSGSTYLATSSVSTAPPSTGWLSVTPVNRGVFRFALIFSVGQYVQELRPLFSTRAEVQQQPEVLLGIAVGTIPGRTYTVTTIATLTADIDDDDATLPLSSVAALTAGVLTTVTIDSEEITVRRSGSVVNVVCRGANGSIAFAHSSGATVSRKRVTFGQGTVAVQQAVQQSDAAWDMTDTCRDLTVLNPCSAIDDDTVVELNRDPHSGQYWVTGLCDAPVLDGSGSGSGSGSSCLCDATCFEASFPGLTTNSGFPCTDCESLQSTFQMMLNLPCEWVYTSPAGGVCSVASFVSFNIVGTNAYLTFGRDGASLIASYTADVTHWDCKSPLVMARATPASDGLFACNNWPATATVSPCAGGGTAPTVDADTDDMVKSASFFAISGSNFEATAANNIGTFSVSAVATCIFVSSAGDASLWQVTGPANAGTLTAVVENVNGSSAPATQIANSVASSVVWTDTFTDADGTAFASHTPDTVPGGGSYAAVTGVLQIQSNKLQATTLVSNAASFNVVGIGRTTWTLTVDVTLPSTPVTASSLNIRPRMDTGGDSNVQLILSWTGTGNDYLLQAGDVSGFETTPVTLVGGTYSFTVVNRSGVIGAQINGAGVAKKTAAGTAGGSKINVVIGCDSAGDIKLDNLAINK